MTTDLGKTEQEQHRKLAAELFNLTWDLLDKSERTVEEVDKMIHAAHASRYHWGEIGTPPEFERGEWQILRVYAVLGHPEAALYHARRCPDLCQANDIGDFDLAFAYEALARSYAVAGNLTKAQEYFTLGEQAGKQIQEAGNREYLAGELAGVSALLS